MKPELHDAIESIRENETNLVLSADGNRLRVIVDGKLIVDFHTNYVLRALAGLTSKRGAK